MAVQAVRWNLRLVLRVSGCGFKISVSLHPATAPPQTDRSASKADRDLFVVLDSGSHAHAPLRHHELEIYATDLEFIAVRT